MSCRGEEYWHHAKRSLKEVSLEEGARETSSYSRPSPFSLCTIQSVLADSSHIVLDGVSWQFCS